MVIEIQEGTTGSIDSSKVRTVLSPMGLIEC